MKTVQRALEILEIFLEKKRDIGISELVQITGLNISTVHSILKELSDKGFIIQRKKRGRYSLGLKFFLYSQTIKDIISVENVFFPFMKELCEEVREPVNLLVNNNNNYSTTIEVVRPSHKEYLGLNGIDFNLRNIDLPLYCTSGKLFLADMSRENLENYYRRNSLIRYTPYTITDIPTLENTLQQIRETNICYDNQEYHLNLRAIAAPVRNGDNIVAIIGVFSNISRMTDEKMENITPLVIKCVENISAALKLVQQ